MKIFLSKNYRRNFRNMDNQFSPPAGIPFVLPQSNRLVPTKALPRHSGRRIDTVTLAFPRRSFSSSKGSRSDRRHAFRPATLKSEGIRETAAAISPSGFVVARPGVPILWKASRCCVFQATRLSMKYLMVSVGCRIEFRALLGSKKVGRKLHVAPKLQGP